MSDSKPIQRVGCYVDGFNLYFGLRDSGLRKFMWLDVAKLASRIACLPHQTIVYSKYFTARISGGKPTDRPAYAAEMEAKRKRQATYLDALAVTGGTQVIEGHFLRKSMECHKCGATWDSAEEKMTDVNIATEMLVDAFANRYDTALLISGDSDLVPPVRAVLGCFGHKRVIVAFPPGRRSTHLAKECSGEFQIHKGALKKSQLPDEIVGFGGAKLTRPDKWH